MGLRRNPPAVLRWASTLEAMKQAGTRVRRVCNAPCTFWEDVDLAAMIALLGEDGSLWDRQPPCDACGRLTHFMASPGDSTPMRPLLSPNHRLESLPAAAWLGGWLGRWD